MMPPQTKSKRRLFLVILGTLGAIIVYMALHWDPEVHYATSDNAARAKIVTSESGRLVENQSFGFGCPRPCPQAP